MSSGTGKAHELALFPKKSFYHQRKPMCIGSDNFLSGSLTRELTFRMLWNNIEGATSPAWCELPHQCIYKQCITGKFASRPPDHPGQHSGSPGWFIGRIWRPGDRICATLPLWGVMHWRYDALIVWGLMPWQGEVWSWRLWCLESVMPW